MRVNRFFHQAVDQAVQGYNNSSVSEKHGAVVASGGKLIGTGYNSTAISPFPWIKGVSKFTHAEPAALFNYISRSQSFRGRRVQNSIKVGTLSSENVCGCVCCKNSDNICWYPNLQFQTLQPMY